MMFLGYSHCKVQTALVQIVYVSWSWAPSGPAARIPKAFFVFPNFLSCFFNSIETREMFSVS